MMKTLRVITEDIQMHTINQVKLGEIRPITVKMREIRRLVLTM